MKEYKTVKEWIESDEKLSKRFYVVPQKLIDKADKKNRRKDDCKKR